MSEYPYPFVDEKDKPICQICGKSYLVISPTHLKKHNIAYADYKKRFPDAPLSSKEFTARGTYWRTQIFKEHEEIGEEQIVEEDDPQVEELDVEKLIEKQPVSPMESMKAKIHDHLKLYYANVRKDYMVRQFGTDSKLKFEFITDFCDPILKVIVQFPDVFWHNEEAGIDPNKNLKLQQYGWKIIEIPTNNPSLKQINKYLHK